MELLADGRGRSGRARCSRPRHRPSCAASSVGARWRPWRSALEAALASQGRPSVCARCYDSCSPTRAS